MRAPADNSPAGPHPPPIRSHRRQARIRRRSGLTDGAPRGAFLEYLAERTAAADGRLSSSEVHMITLMRLIMSPSGAADQASKK